MLKEQLLTSLVVIFVAINAAGANSSNEANDQASSEESDTCIEATPVENFKRDEMAGYWFIKRVEDENFCNSACIRHFLKLRDNDETYLVVRLWKDTSANSTHMQLTNAKLDETGVGVTVDGFRQTIVGVDSSKWAAVIACDECEEFRKALVATSEPNMDISSACSSMTKQKINCDELNEVDQKSCPADWSDAEKDEIDFKYDDIKHELEAIGLI